VAVTIQLASSPALGRELNEDRAGSVGPVAWVLDGASVPESLETCCERDASWLVDHLDATFRRVFVADPLIDLREALKTAIAEAADDHAQGCEFADRHWGPSSTVALGRISSDTADVLVLGGATAIVAQGLETTRISDQRLYEVAVDQRTAARSGRPGAREELVRAERAARNQDGGYWIASDTPAAATQARAESFASHHCGIQVALLTDGAYRAVDPYACVFGSLQLIEELRIQDPGGLIRQVRAYERRNRSGYDERTQASDDATIAWLVTLRPRAVRS
jgi:hypothetical protein